MSVELMAILPGPREAHSCHCRKVHQCQIFVHPDSRIQRLLSDISEEMARYDEQTNSNSFLVFHSDHGCGGTFHSVTQNGGKL